MRYAFALSLLVIVFAACGGSQGALRSSTPGAPPPATPGASRPPPIAFSADSEPTKPPATAERPFRLLSALLEGHLVLTRSFSLETIEGDRLTELRGRSDARFSHDGTYMAFAGDRLSVQATATGAAVALPPAPGPVYTSVWSPVDNHIAYGVGTTVYMTAVPSGDTRAYAVPDGAHPYVWSAGGSALVLVRDLPDNTRTSQLLDLGSSSVTDLPKEADFNSLSPSPDGRYVAYAVGGWFDGWKLGIFDSRTDRACLVTPAEPLRWDTAQKAPFRPGWSADGRYVMYADSHWRSLGFASAHIAEPGSCSDIAITKPVWSAFWSPSGHSLALMASELKDGEPQYEAREVAVWAPDEGVRLISEGAHSVQWEPDGRQLVVSFDQELAWLDLTGKAQRAVTFDGGIREQFVRSPSGRYLAVQGDRGTDLYVVDLQTGTRTLIFTGPSDWFLGAWAR